MEGRHREELLKLPAAVDGRLCGEEPEADEGGNGEGGAGLVSVGGAELDGRVECEKGGTGEAVKMSKAQKKKVSDQ